jgi:hypothetical protein
VTLPRVLARLEVTNGAGTFDSQNPAPSRGDGLDSARIAFEVTKTLEPTPNTAIVRIWNLSQATIDRITGTVRKRLEWSPTERAELAAAGLAATPIEVVYDNSGLASIRLSWGYAGADPTTPFPPLSVGFIGASDSITVESDGLDSVLVIKAEDAGQLLGAARLLKSYKAGTSTVDILADLITACAVQVDKAGLEAAMGSALTARGIPVGKLVQLTGYNASGTPAAQQVKAVMDSLELRWSVQDGEFLLLDSSTVLPGYLPLILSAEAGTLFGTPERLEAQQMRARTWANAEARPGRQVLIEATDLGTQYRIDRVRHTIDTYSGGQSTVTLDALQTIPGLF